MATIKGVDAHQVDATIPAGKYLITPNGLFSVYAQAMVGVYHIKDGVRMNFGRVAINKKDYYSIGKLIAAVYNGVPYTKMSKVSARDGDYTNVCPENIVVVDYSNSQIKADVKGVDAHRIDPKIAEGEYYILKGGVYSMKRQSMVGKYRMKKGLNVDFGVVELGRGKSYGVGKLIAAAYNGVPYKKYDVALARDGDFTNICPENIVTMSRNTYSGKTLQPYQKAKVSDEDVLIIRASAESNTSLGKKYGVSEMQISRIKRRIDRTKI